MDERNCQNRRSRRSQVLLVAKLEHGGTSQAVKLRNLSAEGALVESEKLPIEGTSVHFVRNELNAQGRVVWVNGHYAGIAFDSKLEPSEVLRHVPVPRPKLQPRYWRPGFTAREMTSEQQRLAESWVWSPSASRPGE
ncbi:PilZ domain-containing protein [Sphingomonas sediminicola]|jgi:hypothetical protein|uniref:PilZ domain-containing protein n=1 Tax=Sphingomonas sediminicola TaxID=386874 RepID=A0ABX6T673_9SPHN|nr:PilZ domain-containing protein [Sphingomonas sediminicola]QNP44713.1 PilZ domain-containing protein [Sphingomonas sediminicola]